MANVLELLIKSKNDSKGIKEASEDVKKFGMSVDSTMKAAKLATAAMATGAGIAMGYAVNESRKFETAMSNISTLISGDSTPVIKELEDGVLAMSKAMPKSIDELGGSLYDILSAGIQGTSGQLSVLEYSAKLATAGLGNTKGATDLMTSAINAFGLEATDANKIADVIFKTVKNGKTTVDELAQSFGATAPILASNKISLEEFSAAVAALTTVGMPASQAQNSLRAAMSALSKPTAELTELTKKAGIENIQTALATDGLVSVMKAVSEAAEGSQPMLAKAWGSVEALGAVTSLTGDQYEAFIGTMNDMVSGGDALEEAFQKQSQTVDSSAIMLKNSIDSIAISFGSRFLPHVANAARFIAENLEPAISSLTKFLDENRIVLAIFAGAITAVVLPALYSMATAAIAAGTSMLIALAPLLLIGAALGAVAYLIYEAWNTNFLGVRDVVTSVASYFTDTFLPKIQFVFDFIKTILQVWWNVAVIIFDAFRLSAGIVAEYLQTNFADKLFNMFEAVKGFLQTFKENWDWIFESIGTKVSGVMDGVVDKIKSSLNSAIGFINSLISSVNKVGSAIPGYSQMREIPQFANGVRNFSGGMAIVGERGPELVNLPKGSDVIPNNQMGQSINVTQNIYGNVDMERSIRQLAYQVRTI